jgi:hypothetical protein
MKISVKKSMNCDEMPETEFIELGPKISGKELVYHLDNSDPKKERVFRIVGRAATEGSETPYEVTSVRAQDRLGRPGILIYGGDGGVRILDENAERKGEEDEHLRGYGFPIIWIEDGKGLPHGILEILGVSDVPDAKITSQHKGKILQVNDKGFGVIEDEESHSQFTFTFDKILGYRGQKKIQELGIHSGSHVQFDTTAASEVVSLKPLSSASSSNSEFIATN